MKCARSAKATVVYLWGVAAVALIRESPLGSINEGESGSSKLRSFSESNGAFYSSMHSACFYNLQIRIFWLL
eukprot:SAG22_NODE_568_length_9030_cov_2.503527_5_plen_72_part_00